MIFLVLLLAFAMPGFAVGEDGIVLSVTAFTLLGAIFFFILPFVLGNVVETEVYNTGIKRLLVAISFYLLSLSASILTAFTSTYAGIDINNVLIFYIRIFTMTGYTLIFAVFVKTIFEIIQFKKDNKKKQRMGGDEGEDE